MRAKKSKKNQNISKKLKKNQNYHKKSQNNTYIKKVQKSTKLTKISKLLYTPIFQVLNFLVVFQPTCTVHCFVCANLPHNLQAQRFKSPIL
jgi:hypothetical protein